jgi:hypothetical protein
MVERGARLRGERNKFLIRLLFIRLFLRFVIGTVCVVGGQNAQASSGGVEQALIITIPFNGKSGSNEVVQRLYKLEEELTKAIQHSHAGEYDGNEIGDATFTMYAYGPSADQLFEIALPILGKYELPAGSRAVKRYGKRGAKEERIPLGNGATN